jgi:hypothetical protein
MVTTRSAIKILYMSAIAVVAAVSVVVYRHGGFSPADRGAGQLSAQVTATPSAIWLRQVLLRIAPELFVTYIELKRSPSAEITNRLKQMPDGDRDLRERAAIQGPSVNSMFFSDESALPQGMVDTEI